jgi:CheY-like chemotaxis protein
VPEETPFRGRILVIDDVPAIGRVVEVALPQHEVVVVSQASDAFALFALAETFDVILCDVLMPELGGRDVIERVQRDWPHLASRIVFMTGGAFTAESRAFLGASPQPVLTKPFTIDELQTAVEDQLHQRNRERN